MRHPSFLQSMVYTLEIELGDYIIFFIGELVHFSLDIAALFSDCVSMTGKCTRSELSTVLFYFGLSW